MFEFLFDAISDAMIHFGPRWMRLGCLVVLGLVLVALLAAVFLSHS